MHSPTKVRKYHFNAKMKRNYCRDNLLEIHLLILSSKFFNLIRFYSKSSILSRLSIAFDDFAISYLTKLLEKIIIEMSNCQL